MKLKRVKYVWLFLGMPLVFIFLIYLGISLKFLTSYCYGTQINGVDYTGKSKAYVENELIKNSHTYQLIIKDREGKEHIITNNDINLKWDIGDQLNKIKKGQNNFLWVLKSLTHITPYQVDINVSFNESLLNKKIEGLGFLDAMEPMEPVNAYLSFEEGEYKIIPEIPGNQVNQAKLFEGIKNALIRKKTTIDLVEYGCYDMPEITRDSNLLIDSMDSINLYETSNITYDFEVETVKLTKEQIDSFVEINDNISTISKDKIRNYILTLKDKYDTVGSVREFITWDGRKIEVSKGNYGWSMGVELETNWLTDAITCGRWAVREPEYVTRAFQRGITDIGNTYIEIDMSKQHMWYYENGSLIIDTDVVTGNISKGHGTPGMVACIQYKERNATLNGENYSTPVDYWMPVYKNIGIHDASWRSQFGGQIYKTSGSHGCINTPYNKVKIIYEKVEVGTPVILYY